MKWLRPLVIVPALCLVVAGMILSRRQVQASSDDMDSQTIEDYITGKMRAARIPGLAVVIVKGDQIVYARGFGEADPSGRSMTPQTPVLIGSLTKPFTALAVMQLVEAGKVELDAPVQRYIPWFRVADEQASKQITVRQLLHQTSGMPQPLTSQTSTADDDQALERSVRSLATLKVTAPPGQSYNYSNGNYNTLGMLVQSVTGQSFEEYVKEHILQPLDMPNSYLAQDEALEHGMASGYRWWFGIPVAVTLPFDRSDLPSGYMISSAEDMGHFLIAQLNGGRYQDVSILSAEGIDLTHREPVPDTYGMGWASNQIDGRTLINHDGGNPNFSASVFMDPEARVGVFVGSNIFSGLDVLSAPQSHGGDLRDGPTVRAIAQSVLNLATNQPLPAQGIGNARLYLLLDGVLLALSAGLALWIARTPGRFRRLEQKGIRDVPTLLWRTALVAVVHFSLPLLILYLELQFPPWKVYVMYQPDAIFWLEVVATILAIKGVFDLAMVWQVFNQSRQHQMLQPV